MKIKKNSVSNRRYLFIDTWTGYKNKKNKVAQRHAQNWSQPVILIWTKEPRYFFRKMLRPCCEWVVNNLFLYDTPADNIIFLIILDMSYTHWDHKTSFEISLFSLTLEICWWPQYYKYHSNSRDIKSYFKFSYAKYTRPLYDICFCDMPSYEITLHFLKKNTLSTKM